MAAKRRVNVVCGCGWRGKRVNGMDECWHEYPGCRCAYRSCPKCGGYLSEAAYVRRLKVAQQATDAWWEREGKFKYGMA